MVLHTWSNTKFKNNYCDYRETYVYKRQNLKKYAINLLLYAYSAPLFCALCRLSGGPWGELGCHENPNVTLHNVTKCNIPGTHHLKGATCHFVVDLQNQYCMYIHTCAYACTWMYTKQHRFHLYVLDHSDSGFSACLQPCCLNNSWC